MSTEIPTASTAPFTCASFIPGYHKPTYEIQRTNDPSGKTIIVYNSWVNGGGTDLQIEPSLVNNYEEVDEGFPICSEKGNKIQSFDQISAKTEPKDLQSILSIIEPKDKAFPSSFKPQDDPSVYCLARSEAELGNKTKSLQPGGGPPLWRTATVTWELKSDGPKKT